MPDRPKYDAVYAEGPDALGPQNKAVSRFFKELSPPLAVLDLGAGQGRDAIPIAQLGFKVTAVDVSTIGLKDLDEKAAKSGLEIETICADLCDFSPSAPYDVLLADRTFHMLPENDRHRCLARCLEFANPGARVLIVDENNNIPGLKSVFDRDSAPWQVTHERRGYLSLRREI